MKKPSSIDHPLKESEINSDLFLKVLKNHLISAN